MANTIAQKLKIKEGMTLLTLHAPSNFEETLSPPANVTISTSAKKYDQLHWFVTNKAQLDKELDKVIKLVNDDVLCWTYYPKGTSKIQTDLTRDKGWEELLKQDMQWITLVSFDDTWSAFAFRLKNDADKKKEASPPKVREIFSYADSATKTIRLPDDLAEAFKKDKNAHALFDKLAFSHRREYIEWIITAKREETRKSRIEGTIERLQKGWKNPSNIG